MSCMAYIAEHAISLQIITMAFDDSIIKSAHAALAVKACLLGGKTATLNAQ